MLNTGKRTKTRVLSEVKLVSIVLLSGIFLAGCAGLMPAPSPTPLPPTSSPTDILQIQPQPSEEFPAAQTAVPATQAAPATTPLPATPAVPGGVHAFPDPAIAEWLPVADRLNRPVGIAHAGDGSRRLFILEQKGRIRVFQDGALLPESFLDIRERVGADSNEQGLLGLAFHPHFAKNGFFYVNYTDLNGDTVIARFEAGGAGHSQAEPASERALLQVRQPYPNHNGGHLVFGPDGYLYAGLGEGGSANDPKGNGQSTQTLLGKLLRIDVDQGERYAIPPDNPFASGGGLPEIWALGLRNPWRFSFDRLTGDLYIGDVGQNQWEEIDFWPAAAGAGANFGWDYREGTHAFEGSPPPGAGLVEPVAEYDHSAGCSVTGGTVYRGSALPELSGVYLFADYCSGVVYGLLRDGGGAWQMQALYESGARVTAFGEDEDGEVYLADHAGRLLRLQRKPLRVAVIGDYGLAGPAEERVAELVLSWKPDIILTVGDNNYPSGDGSTIDDNIGQYYHAYIAPYSGKYGAGAVENRFFPTLGNHDWDTDSAQAYLDFFSLPNNERYYEFARDAVHFFALDSDSREPDGVGASSIQAAWLRQQLAASGAAWKIVFMHHPPYSSGLKGPVDWMVWPFAGWGADAVISGHDHVYERLQIDGIPYFINGLGGGAIYNFLDTHPGSQVRYNQDYGAMLLEADSQQLSFRFYSISGEMIDSLTLQAGL